MLSSGFLGGYLHYEQLLGPDVDADDASPTAAGDRRKKQKKRVLAFAALWFLCWTGRVCMLLSADYFDTAYISREVGVTDFN